MIGGVIDTNILLYAANKDCREHSKAREFLTEACDKSQFFLTEGICYEFLRVATHQRVFATPLRSDEAVSFLSTMIEMPNITVLSATFRHWKTLSEVLKELHFPSGNLFFDIHTAALMFEHGVSVIYTADADFFQFSELQVINPLSL